MKIIYLDNASSTKVSKRVIKKITKSYKYYSNSNSDHLLSKKPKKIIEKCKKRISEIINCEKKKIFFSPSSSLSNKILIEKIKKKYVIVTSKIEHKSIIKNVNKKNNKKIFIKIKKNGKYDEENIKKIITNNKKLFFIISWVNSETGVIQNINKIIDLIKREKIFIDITQAFGKININIRSKKIEYLTASSNKIHGPQGIGFIYSRKKKIKLGTQATSLIAGFSEACKINKKEKTKENKKILKIRKIIDIEAKKNKRIKINFNNTLNIINIYIKKIDREIIKSELYKNFAISFFSACNNIEKNNYSYVLKETGLKKKNI